MPNKTYNIELTKSQLESLIKFFQLNFVEAIRDTRFLQLNFIEDVYDDKEVDVLKYLCDMCGVYQMLKDCVRGADNG